MSLVLESGLIQFANASGGVNWSSADKNLRIVDEVVSSFQIRNKTFDSGSLILTEETTLGTVPASASVVFGNYIIGSSVFSIGGDRTYYFANERMINLDAYETSTTGTSMPAKHIWYRVEIVGTFLKAFVFYRFPQLASPFTGGTTVQVRALIGGFEF